MALRTDRGRQARTAAALAVPVVAATLALVHPGTPEAQVHLHDGAVWLTNTSQRMLGRYNAQVDELNAAVVADDTEFDVLQDEGDVVLVERGALTVVDPAAVVAAGQVTVPSGADVSMANGVVAVADRGTGDVWVRPVDRLGTLDVTGPGDLELGPGGVAVVAPSGAVLGARTDGTLVRATLPTGPDGRPVAGGPGEGTGAQGEGGDGAAEGAAAGLDVTETGTLAGGSVPEHGQVTAVGDTLVTLTDGVVRTPGGSVRVPGEDAALQQPGPAADVVLVATATALLEVPLDGGEPVVHETGSTGAPARPVRVAGCAHAAWATAAGSYLRLCGDAAPVALDLEGMTTSDRLVFRVNRDVVVLNDTLRGRLWLPLEDARLHDPDWTLVEPQDETEQSDAESDERERTQDIQAECTPESAPPAAVDDDFGVRAGRTVLLPVIDNDSSSECGILAISEFDPVPEAFGTLTSVYGGRMLQLTVRPDARGTVETTYTITDGRGTSAPSTASVRITVRPDQVNAAPVQLRTGSLAVEQGASTTYDVLADFRDPDGDQLLLVGATVPGGGTVRTRLDGELTFTSDGSTLGRQTVTVLVSDGRETVEGSVLVDVRPAGSLPPVIDPVLASTYVDEPVVVRPLSAVRSVSREPVRLAEVQQVAGATVEAELSRGRFTFTAPSAGTYYVTFTVTATPQEATGVARIDVRERPETVPPPVAVRDVALLPPGGEVTIAPLDNDEDPGGNVLVLQEVDVPEGTGLEVAVLRHELLRISSTRVLTEPVVVRYTVSNGAANAVGEVLVLPVTPSGRGQPPVVPDVRTSVRTDGIVTVDVLANAYDPDGDPLTLEPDLVEQPAQGLMFASGDVIRFRAPSTPGRVRATFAVSDPAGNVVAATITVDVHAADPQAKAPPRPRNLVARVFEGQRVRIEVPLTGIDDDGDGVMLLGPASAPAKGRVVDQGPDWLEYEAFPGELGTDTFQYAVEDWVGQRAVATIRVGIASVPTAAAQVVSRDDDVVVRPGRTVEVRVLVNDVDTAGGELTLDPELVHDEGVDARVDGRRVVVTAPDEPGVLQIGYTAHNDRGGRDTAVLTVVVDPEAPILPPVAQDVVVPATETINRTSVEVDVLSLAINPSGPLSDLAVSVHPSAADVASVTPAGRVLVQLAPTPQTIPYLLTNTDPDAGGRSAYAFITVPALGDFPPVRRPRAPELQVISGEELLIPLAEQVQVGPGRTARIADRGAVTATRSDGSALSVDDETLRFVSRPGYAGPASISFPVTDQARGDTRERTTFLTLPITVLAIEENPPTFAPSVLELGPGESTRVDLRRFTRSPDGTTSSVDAYRYRLTSQPSAGVTATLTGSELVLEAAPSVPRGTVGGVGIEIGYGATGTVGVQVDYRVTASTRPLARVVSREVEGVQGRAVTVPVLEDAFNPFPGEPLTLVSATVETPGAGSAEVQGAQLVVRPDDAFVGRMVTRFAVRDVTGDPDRTVEGRVTLVVRGRPEAPSAPRVVEVGDRTVALAWDAPEANGAPITGYLVSGGGRTVPCASTSCTITDLTNDVEYRFTVVAVNEVGESPPSPPSAPARPDARPAAPAAPEVQWLDGAVRATWSAPQNPGSSIVRYDVEITPAAPGGASIQTSSTSATFTGLTNGTAYTVRVRAVNSAPDPGDWSQSSAPVVPAGPPIAQAPVPVPASSTYGTGSVTLTWPAAVPNGDQAGQYQVRRVGGETVDVGTALTHTFTGLPLGEHTFEVRAANKAGWGAWATSAKVVLKTPPDRPVLTARQASGDAPYQNGTVVLSVQVDWALGETRNLRTSVDGGGWQEFSSSVGGLPAGTHTFAVQACNEVSCSEPSATVSVDVQTAPSAPRAGGITFTTEDPSGETTGLRATWTAPSNDGGARVTGYLYQVRVSGPEGDGTWSRWQSTGATEVTAPVPRALRESGGRVEVRVVALNARGQSPVLEGGAMTATFDAPPGEEGAGG